MAHPAVNPLDKASDAEVAELVEHLTDYALRKMRKLSWRGVRFPGASRQKGELTAPGGLSPGDIAAEAIVKFLDGSRTWDNQKEPDFRQFLRGVIDSLVSHLVRSSDNAKTREAPVAAAAKVSSPYLESKVAARGSDAKTPLELSIDEEWREKVRMSVFKEVKDDPLLEGLQQCYSAGLTPAETAQMLDIPVSDVYNAHKRMSRKLDKLCGKLARSANS